MVIETIQLELPLDKPKEERRPKYFDSKRDARYGFFCQACLTGKPESERSEEDSRYCKGCLVSLENETAPAMAQRGERNESW